MSLRAVAQSVSSSFHFNATLSCRRSRVGGAKAECVRQEELVVAAFEPMHAAACNDFLSSSASGIVRAAANPNSHAVTHTTGTGCGPRTMEEETGAADRGVAVAQCVQCVSKKCRWLTTPWGMQRLSYRNRTGARETTIAPTSPPILRDRATRAILFPLR